MTRDICLLNAEYQTYGERWFILLVALFCNMAAGLLWMPYSAMTDKASIYFQVSEDHIELWPTIVFGSCVCAGIPAMWVLDRKCLKSGLRIGSLLVMIGWLFRAVPICLYGSSSVLYVPSSIGHVLLGFGIPFLAFTPSTIAENWFAESQRFVAITIVSIGNLIGLMITYLFGEKLAEIGFTIGMQTGWLGVPSVIVFLATCFIRNSKPKSAPSANAAIIAPFPFASGIRQLFNQTPFLFLLAYIGSSIGSMFSMLGITRRLVMAHSPYFCGIFGFVLIGSGIIGTLVAIVLVKKLYELVLVLKLAVAGHCISISLLYLALNYNHQPANSSWTLDTFVPFDSGFVLLTLSGLTGFFGHMVIPIGLDLAGDCSFPHNTQAASNGLLLISGYVQSLLYAGIMQAFSTQVIHCKGYKDNNDSFSSSHVLLVSRMSGWQSLVDRLCNTYTDYSVSLMVQTVIMVLMGCFFIIIFETEYRRMNIRRRMQANRLLILDSRNSS